MGLHLVINQIDYHLLITFQDYMKSHLYNYINFIMFGVLN